MISVASKEIAGVLSKLTESEGGVDRTVSIAALTFMMEMHLLQEYMHLIVLFGADKRVSEELLSPVNKDLVGEPIRDFLVEWNNSDLTSSVDKQQLAKDVIDAVRVVNESSEAASGRKTKQLSKGREVVGIVTAAGDMTPVEAMCNIFCWNVVRAVEEASNDPVKLKAHFYENSNFTTTTKSVKEPNPLMKVEMIGDARTISRINSPNEFELTGSLPTLRNLGDLFSGKASIQTKLIQTFKIQQTPPQDDSSKLVKGKPAKRKRSKKKKTKGEQPSSDNNGGTADTEENDAKKQRTTDCGTKTIVTQTSGSTSQYKVHGIESKEELESKITGAVNRRFGDGLLRPEVLAKIAEAVVPLIQDMMRSERDINELIASDDVQASNETTFEAIDGFVVGRPYEDTAFFEVIYKAWENVKWREWKEKHKVNMKVSLKTAEQETVRKWEKDLGDEDLKTAIEQIEKDMNRSIVFMTRKEGKLVTEEYKEVVGDVNPYKTIYIYGEERVTDTNFTTKNTAYKWMVPENNDEKEDDEGLKK